MKRKSFLQVTSQILRMALAAVVMMLSTLTAEAATVTFRTALLFGETLDYSLQTENDIKPKNIDYDGGTITQDENGYTVIIYDDFNAMPLPIDDDGKIVNLTYNRKLEGPIPDYFDKEIEGKAARLYTLCLPFAPKTTNGMKFYTLSAATATTLTFSEVPGTPVANTPYLVVITGNFDIEEYCYNYDVESMAIKSETKDGYTFTGTFKGLDNTAAVGKYILQPGGKWSIVPYGNAGVFIPPFRAYIIGPAADARVLNSDFVYDATTIQIIRTIDNDGTERWYDLNGRPVSKPFTNGIYIHNGKKVVIKSE